MTVTTPKCTHHIANEKICAALILGQDAKIWLDNGSALYMDAITDIEKENIKKVVDTPRFVRIPDEDKDLYLDYPGINCIEKYADEPELILVHYWKAVMPIGGATAQSTLATMLSLKHTQFITVCSTNTYYVHTRNVDAILKNADGNFLVVVHGSPSRIDGVLSDRDLKQFLKIYRCVNAVDDKYGFVSKLFVNSITYDKRGKPTSCTINSLPYELTIR